MKKFFVVLLCFLSEDFSFSDFIRLVKELIGGYMMLPTWYKLA